MREAVERGFFVESSPTVAGLGRGKELVITAREWQRDSPIKNLDKRSFTELYKIKDAFLWLLRLDAGGAVSVVSQSFEVSVIEAMTRGFFVEISPTAACL